MACCLVLLVAMLCYVQSCRTAANDDAADSWVEISSQPSSSSLSSINDEVVTTGLRVQQDPRYRRRRTLRPGAPSHLHIEHRAQSVGASSQEEYEESESESDRVMTSSGEGGLHIPGTSFGQDAASEDDDEKRTAINYPIRNDLCFTPQPNAFSHPPSGHGMRNASAPVPGSYFPSTRPSARTCTRQSYAGQRQQSHVAPHPLSPSFDAAAQHDEALRASLSTLLSVAAAARGQSKPDAKRTVAAAPAPGRRSDPMTFRLVSESALRQRDQPVAEPTFLPTLPRRMSPSTSASSLPQHRANDKRKAAPPRSPTRDERRASKKARRSASNEDLPAVSPTLLTWVVSAGVVVVLSAALGFGAGYSLGKEAGRLEVEQSLGVGSCAREASRGMGLKRSLARGAVTAV